jgi:hypothetical protein
MSIDKIKVKKEIFSSTKSSPFTWKDLKGIEFEDDDMIFLEYEDDDPNVPEGYFIAKVERFVEETDEEQRERIERSKLSQEISKKMRYQTYLKLKEEFEN